MHRPRFPFSFLLALIALAEVFGVFGCGSNAPEKTLIDRYFRASRYHDNATLGSIAAVAFDPATQGIVESFSVVSVGAEQSGPLHLREWSAQHQQAVKADSEYATEMRAYRDGHADAITRLLDAEANNRAVAAKDAVVQAEWNKWRDGQRELSKKVSEAKQKIAGERSTADLSIHQGLARAVRDPIDVTRFDGTIVSKDYTISANVMTTSGQHLARTLVVTLQRVVLRDPDGLVPQYPGRTAQGELVGKWIITMITEAPGSGR